MKVCNIVTYLYLITTMELEEIRDLIVFFKSPQEFIGIYAA